MTGSQPRIPDQLVTSILHRECVFFIGAGLSIDAGLPSGDRMAQKLLEMLQRNGYEKGMQPLYKIAEDFQNLRGRPDLVRIIYDVLTRAQQKVDDYPYRLLAQVRPQPIDIVTTNWDKNIEDSYGRENILVILEDEALSKHSPARTNLVKIHGDLDNLENAVITETDYVRFREVHAGFYQKLSTLFRENTILFIGYSTEDWDFLETYLEIQKDLKENSNPRYCVTPTDAPEVLAQLQKLDIKHMTGTATEFLSSLVEEVEGKEGKTGKLYEEHLEFPDPTLPEVVTRNPFVVFRAEDMSEELWHKEFFREPKMYNTFSDIILFGNTVIEGHRGSGKSTILLYLSYPVQKLLQKDPNFVGVYVKLDLPLFATTRKRGENRDDWVDFFLSYFNLVVAEELITVLSLAADKSWVTVSDREKLLQKLRQVLLLSNRTNIATLTDLADCVYEKRNEMAGAPPRPKVKVPADLIKSLIVRIRRFVPQWAQKSFFVLLDEYERLDEDQQRVVNLLLASRGPTYREKTYFKIATKSFMLCLDDVDGNPLEPVDDFTPVVLDRFDLGEERKRNLYRSFIEEIANWRLQSIWKYGTSIEELLPKGRGGVRDHSGLKNIVTLSSFLPRDFLELCKDMVFYAYPSLLTERKRDKLEPISPSIQNTVIEIHADSLFENLNRIVDEEERPLPKTRAENARRLVESLGIVFRRILEGSRSKEKRTVSEFQIRNSSRLNTRILNALSDCTRQRALVVPLTKRAPQIRRNIPADRYELHRLLCARFGFSLARRWPKEMDAEWLNDLIDAEDPKKIQAIIDELTHYFVHKEEFPVYEQLPLLKRC